MKAFILAAGFGTRLRPLTETLPKPLLPLGRLPLIGYSLRLLAKYGFKEVIINLHHLGKMIREELGDGSAYGVKITYSAEEEILGTGGGLRRAYDLLAGETFVVINSDVLLDVDLLALVKEHKARGALATMLLRAAPPGALEAGPIEVDAEGRIRRILGQGPPPERELRNFLFCSVHVMEPELLNYVPADMQTCIIRYAYQKALRNNEPLYGSFFTGDFRNIDSPEAYYAANVDMLTSNLRLEHVNLLHGFTPAAAAKQLLEAEVKLSGEQIYVGRDLELGRGVELQGPLLLMDKCQLGDKVKLGPGVIVGQGAQIAKGVELKHTVILPEAKVAAQQQLTDVLIGKKDLLPFTRIS